eukprot:6186584-Pleurochrysis_carterae.AAC.1
MSCCQPPLSYLRRVSFFFDSVLYAQPCGPRRKTNKPAGGRLNFRGAERGRDRAPHISAALPEAHLPLVMGTSCSRSVLADVSASFGEQEGSISPSRIKAEGEALFATSKAGSTSTEGSTLHASTHSTRKGFATPTCIRNYDEEQRRKHLSESPRETAPDDLGGGATATKSDNLSEKGIDTSDERKG